MAAHSICSIPDCGNAAVKRGWCNAHYRRWLRHGDPMAGRIPNGEAHQFLELALSYDDNDCLLWPYARCPKGYGRINLKGQSQVVSHIVCKDAHGEPPTPLHEAAHSCGNGHMGCVNKRHLSWKTPAENEADKLTHGTSTRGERHPFAKLTEEEVRLIYRDPRIHEVIAAEYGVSAPTVSNIKCRRSWSWLDLDADAA